VPKFPGQRARCGRRPAGRRRGHRQIQVTY